MLEKTKRADNRPKILIFEPDAGGHRLHYVRVMVESFSQVGVEIIFVTTVETYHSVEYKTHLQGLESEFEVDVDAVVPRHPSSLYWLRTYQMLAKGTRRHHPDRVFIPFGDGLTQTMGVLNLFGIYLLNRKIPLHVVLFRGPFPGCGRGLACKLYAWFWQKATAAASVKIYHLINPLQYNAIQLRGFPELQAKCRMLPEPVEAIDAIVPHAARRELGIPESGRYIACLGRLDQRKGVDLLLEAFAEAKTAENDRLLLMGKADKDIRDLLDGRYSEMVVDQKVVVIDRYVSQRELELGLASADVICTPYPAHTTSSGFVVRAAALGKPVLASKVGWMGEVVPRFELGQTCDVSDLDEFSMMLTKVLAISADYQPSERAKAFSKYHSIENCISHWQESLMPSKPCISKPHCLEWESLDPTPTLICG